MSHPMQYGSLLLKEVLRPPLDASDAMQLRREITPALHAGTKPPTDEREHLRNQRIVEPVLGRVVVPLADQRNRLAAAVDDVRAPSSSDPGREVPHLRGPVPVPDAAGSGRRR
ncbi:hypothetical protein ACFYOA_26360 [Streptomyces iakyrus]|uniref:hypothetical protein n=1 Tax=Streptomyces iakyrus TaxID=68219 RepID=UPI0036B188C7